MDGVFNGVSLLYELGQGMSDGAHGLTPVLYAHVVLVTQRAGDGPHRGRKVWGFVVGSCYVVGSLLWRLEGLRVEGVVGLGGLEIRFGRWVW